MRCRSGVSLGQLVVGRRAPIHHAWTARYDNRISIPVINNPCLVVELCLGSMRTTSSDTSWIKRYLPDKGGTPALRGLDGQGPSQLLGPALQIAEAQATTALAIADEADPVVYD